mgnify:CR=1 FL=1
MYLNILVILIFKIMPRVLKLGITDKSGNAIKEVNSIEVMVGKGITGDRHFSENKSDREQITLIERTTL